MSRIDTIEEEKFLKSCRGRERLEYLLRDTTKNKERWLSGRKQHPAKMLGSQGPRGFESHPLRKINITFVAMFCFVEGVNELLHSRWDSNAGACSE